MAQMGNGYGSEYHLLRFLGRHRNYLDQQVSTLLGGDQIEWLDHKFDKKTPSKDHEWKSLDFISSQSSVVQAWQKWWPTGSGIHNWDAVGRIKIGESWEWVLVEAKAHVEEILGAAHAVRGLDQITRALTDVKTALGAPPDRDWLKGYYQFCNRVAALYFLTSHGENAHLLFIYFVGDRMAGRICPQSADDWESSLAAQSNWVGLPEANILDKRIHKIFLPVCPIADAGDGNCA